MARVLVTGASGFVGSHIARRLLVSHEVSGTIWQAVREPVSRCFRIDLTNRDSVVDLLNSIRPEIVIHCAAMSRVIVCQEMPALAQAVNFESTSVLSEWCASNASWMIYFSSDQVYSGETGRYTESDTPSPLNVYGQTKLEAENQVLESSSCNVVVRSNSVAGESIGWGESFTEWVAAGIHQNRSLNLFDDQFRSPIHIDNLVDLMARLCASDFAGVINVGGPERLSRYETACIVAGSSSVAMKLFKRSSYKEHPHAAIMPADTSYSLHRVLDVMPELAERTLADAMRKSVASHSV